MNKFMFEIQQRVRIRPSEEEGLIIGRAEYRDQENGYLLRYCAGDGRATEQWWSESALAKAEPAK